MSDYLAQVVRQRDAAVERAQRAEQLLAAAEDELQKRRGVQHRLHTAWQSARLRSRRQRAIVERYRADRLAAEARP